MRLASLPGSLPDMKNPKHPIRRLASISALHQALQVPRPTHSLVSVVDLRAMQARTEQTISYSFYTIAFKTLDGGQLRYGQQHYDFDEGVMIFTAPHQAVRLETDVPVLVEGCLVVVHPDFLQGYPLARKIAEYGFFSYAAREALHLSAAEQQQVLDMMHRLAEAVAAPITSFTQDIIVAHLDLLLTYCNQFYHRQFLTRRVASHDVVTRFEELLTTYVAGDQLAEHGQPSVQELAGRLHLSANYLSDLLRTYTGLTARQHLQHKLLAHAKELLTTTSLSVGEVAYRLGFEHSQSFNRFFKQHATVSPLDYRLSVN
jgi:AraC family transcriptional activator of pobA